MEKLKPGEERTWRREIWRSVNLQKREPGKERTWRSKNLVKRKRRIVNLEKRGPPEKLKPGEVEAW